MPTPESRILGNHTYDGIQEYDNPTPGWWNAIFFFTFVFASGYFLFFQLSPASWTIQDSYQMAVATDLRKQFSEIGDLQPDEATLVRFMNDQKWLTVGRSTFAAQCVSCHGAKGEGLIGPNMTDDYYKNVRTLEDLPSVIANGAANGAMPAWKTRLHPNEIVLVSAYIASLRGENRSSPRPREGDAIAPWPTGRASSESVQKSDMKIKKTALSTTIQAESQPSVFAKGS